jgi:hypothetical protein
VAPAVLAEAVREALVVRVEPAARERVTFPKVVAASI